MTCIHSFIHSGHFYSASSSPLLLRSSPDYSTDTLSEFHIEAHRQLQVKDLPEVPRQRRNEMIKNDKRNIYLSVYKYILCNDLMLAFSIVVSAPPRFRCPAGMWECPGNYRFCINQTQVCDGIPNCPNGNDESPVCS